MIKASEEEPRKPLFFRANGGTQTPDLLITNQLLYHLSYISACPRDNINYFCEYGNGFFGIINRLTTKARISAFARFIANVLGTVSV